MKKIRLHVDELAGSRELNFNASKLVICAYSGRDINIVKMHVKEAKQEGIPEPEETPEIYVVSPEIITTDNVIKCGSNKTSGEIEYVIFIWSGEVYVGVGSDHTDRAIETVNVKESKEACPKPISNKVWLYKEIKSHWDECILKCEVNDGVNWRTYQQGKVSLILEVETLISKVKQRLHWSDAELNGAVIFSGTIPTVSGKIEYNDKYKMALLDPMLGREISFKYEVVK
ncbi:MAG: DUF2848 family protein [Candidatus Odinarchaeia archaeon]